MEASGPALHFGAEREGIIGKLFGRFSTSTLGSIIVGLTILLIITFLWARRNKKNNPEQRRLNRRERRELETLEELLNANAANSETGELGAAGEVCGNAAS